MTRANDGNLTTNDHDTALAAAMTTTPIITSKTTTPKATTPTSSITTTTTRLVWEGLGSSTELKYRAAHWN